ncbi:MAG: hypothetical protein MN733_24070, partial [Nitrososphaera sp.]|nr:hypothetical protein [Nitrososphaera sp.]
TRNGESVQLNHLMAEFFPTISIKQEAGKFDLNLQIDFGSDDELLMHWKNDQARVLTLKALHKVEIREVSFKITVSKYEQIDYEGTLAWSVLWPNANLGKPAP